MSALVGQLGELKMTVQITRKETGETEEVEMVGFLNEEQLKQLQQDAAQPKE